MKENKYNVMHLSEAIWGGGVTLGTPWHLPNDIYKSSLPKTNIVQKKATNGKEVCSAKSKGAIIQKVLLAIINFLFAITIHMI